MKCKEYQEICKPLLFYSNTLHQVSKTDDAGDDGWLGVGSLGRNGVLNRLFHSNNFSGENSRSYT